LEAFAEVGKKIGRTAGACGFRWNAVLRQQDPQAYNKAKKQRVLLHLQNKRKPRFDSLSSVIQQLKQEEKQYLQLKKSVEDLSEQVKAKNERLSELKKENQRLQEEQQQFQSFQKELQERYQEFLHLLQLVKEEAKKDEEMLAQTDEKETFMETEQKAKS
jgi:prespore-specific regulator